MSGEPIFVVGVPRSGTTLLASLLAAHPALSCGPETAFFASLAATGGGRALRRGWPESGVAFLETAELEGESLAGRYGLEREALAEALRSRPPAPRSLLEVLGEAEMRRAGKRRWVEKSPVHLLYARQIRRHFPRSPIVRIVRDPRDVAQSLVRVPWGPGDLASALLYWRRFHETSRSFFARDARVWTVRYEELLETSEPVLGRLFDFLGEPPAPEGLAGERPAERLVRRGESWKGNVGGALDRSRAGRWRALPSDDRELADGLVGDCLVELGYPLGGPVRGRGWVWLRPRHERALLDRRTAEWIRTERPRLWPAHRGERPRMGLLVGEPDADDWLGRRSGERLGRALGILGGALRLRLVGRPVRWRRGAAAGGEAAAGLAAGLLAAALAPLATVERPSE